MTAPATVPDHVPAHLVKSFDFRNDKAISSDPYGYIASLNDCPEIFFSPDLGGYWIARSTDAIEEIFADHERFTATSLAIPKRDASVVLIPNNFDPPKHTAYRKAMANNLFSPRALATIDPDTRAFTLKLFDEFTPGRCEFVSEFAYKLPIDTFLNLMGADLSLRDQCLSWIKLIFRGQTVEETNQGFIDAFSWVTEWLQQQLANPAANQGPMFQALMRMKIDGKRPDFDDMRSMTLMLFSGGLDTITSQMTHIMRFLAENPGHRDYLLQNPSAIPVALEELLRRFGISFIGRAAAKDQVFRGVVMKQGDVVCAGTPIAGLDADQWHNPLEVDFDRAGGRRVKHLGFGAGPHLCIGAYLARKQLTIMIEELLPRMPDLRIAPDAGAIESHAGATLMLKKLPLEWNVAT
ncbi:putative cytochrome P450 [Caenibius tardaugens NBRC 16725]|uniref:Putative cytochrome P450 n=1 Tax=Caenibius tardaugens NBRC 16725 TaxID=1219035 RepID=U2ZWT0_9SPHN|nr:cytochrome P450 [Caenibius tardaugens]AZI37655.1 cytochrome P450 [Caenibius tardaugens NBRC 16725]GAD49809.1 putative cytochrome P450 [Caenibius tardaugens NBRC 16725]